ncbi:hypothetical protein CAZ03_33915, partial [Pseudomonas aeruginosa]
IGRARGGTRVGVKAGGQAASGPRGAGSGSALGGYLLRGRALILPTLLGILLIHFAMVQAAPGGRVDQAMARLQGVDGGGPPGAAWTMAKLISRMPSRVGRISARRRNR